MRSGYFFDHWQRLGARAHERKLVMLKLISALENWAEVSELSRHAGMAMARLARFHLGGEK
jgi:hypothetical protein